MESRAKLFGHSVHQMLIVFPLGLLASAVLFDTVGLTRGKPSWGSAAYHMIPVGIAAGLLAAVFGLVDWLAIPAGTRAKRIGMLHGVGNVIVVLLFSVSWLLRRHNPEVPTGLVLTLSFVAVALALVTAWMGGELVDRLGVGIDDGAHIDAPSSLSGQPANPRNAATASYAARRP